MAGVRSHVSPCVRGLGWDWMEGWRKTKEVQEDGFMVGGAAGFYGRHKSLHDRHLFQSILTGVLQRKAET